MFFTEVEVITEAQNVVNLMLTSVVLLKFFVIFAEIFIKLAKPILTLLAIVSFIIRL